MSDQTKITLHLASGQSCDTEIEVGDEAEDDEILRSVRDQLDASSSFLVIGSVVVHSKAVSAIELR